MTVRAIELRTARMRLRRARPADLEAIHAIMADEETMRYWSTPPHASREETRRWLDSMLSADPETGDEFVLELDGELIGKLGAWRLPEIGFFLRRDHWGKGLASEALDGFVRYIASTGVTFLTADVDPLNTACLDMLIAAGFRETGRELATFTIGSRVCDSVYLRLNLAAR
jgi:[ribosomal protein S5]-alanine N-acetyltransferase